MVTAGGHSLCWEMEEGMVPSSFFVPGGFCPQSLSNRPCSEMSKWLSLPSAPSVFKTACSVLYLLELFVLLSLWMGSLLPNPSGLSQSQACRCLKCQGLSLLVVKNSQNSALFSFKGKYNGNSSSPFLGSLVSKSVFHPFLHYKLSSPQWKVMVPIAPRPCPFPFYLSQCGLFTTFRYGVYSASLWVAFWAI